ncbi:uncharacterized protein B0T23DRAFT_443452 [Neurospora hispaniola]|uniref:Uncharacterized protein n=1 Tax=Neurospora hispaniola TaxID=588809 RepID=A0AAJ0MQA6_9PEZI|nr:hypothetical protein B0T23DRAFT_443452 [Neurospora hispaniola]
MVTRGKIKASNRSDLSFLFLGPRKTLSQVNPRSDAYSHGNAVFSYPFVSPLLLSTCSPLSNVKYHVATNVSRASRPSSTKCLEVLCARWCGTGIPARFCDTLQMICWLGRLMSLPIFHC